MKIREKKALFSTISTRVLSLYDEQHQLLKLEWRLPCSSASESSALWTLLTIIIFCALVKIKLSYCSSTKFEDRRQPRNSHRSGHTDSARTELPPVGQGWNAAYVDAHHTLVPQLQVFCAGLLGRAFDRQSSPHYGSNHQVSMTLKVPISVCDRCLSLPRVP